MHKNVSSFLKDIERNKTLFEGLEKECLYSKEQLYVNRGFLGKRSVEVKKESEDLPKLTLWMRLRNLAPEPFNDYEDNYFVPKLKAFKQKHRKLAVLKNEQTFLGKVSPTSYKTGDFLKSMKSISTPLHNLEIINSAKEGSTIYEVKGTLTLIDPHKSIDRIKEIFLKLKYLLGKAQIINDLSEKEERNTRAMETILTDPLVLNVLRLINIYTLYD